jgi:hypothetical protein
VKLIISKFVTRCGACKKVIPAGSRCYWTKGMKPLHTACYLAGKQSIPSPTANVVPASIKVRGQYYPDFTIDWSELRPMIRDATGEGTQLQGWNKPHNRNRFRQQYGSGGDIDDSFSGFTRGQMHRWVTKGYETDAIQGLAGLTPPIREKRRTKFVEDGDELHLDRVFSGEDNFMSRDTKREVIPGVKLNIELDASAGSSKMLFNYQRWIAQTIYALEVSGVDIEVNIFTLSTHLFREQGSRTTRQVVRVKKFGEIADFAGFSAMFSPGAFRGIMFSLFSLHADRQNLTQMGYGAGVTNAWGCRYNPESFSIDVACHWTATEFPESQMTGLLRQAITEMKSGN